MRLGLSFREQIQGVSGWLVEEFDQLFARILGHWKVEHNEDGTHAAVTATSLTTTGDVTISGDLLPNADATFERIGTSVDLGDATDQVWQSGAINKFAVGRVYTGPGSGAASNLAFQFKDDLDTGWYYDTSLARWVFWFGGIEVLRLQNVTGKSCLIPTLAAGSWTTPTYAAGNFTGNGAMTWTVDAGDVTTYAWLLIYPTMWVVWYLPGTSVGGSPDTDLRIVIPNGMTAAKLVASVGQYNDNGTLGNGMIFVNAGGTRILLRKNDFSAWTASTNNTLVAGTLCFEVQ